MVFAIFMSFFDSSETLIAKLLDASKDIRNIFLVVTILFIIH